MVCVAWPAHYLTGSIARPILARITRAREAQGEHMAIPKYFDTDQHLTEPPDFWTGRIPKKFAEREPRFMHHPTMGPGWSWDNGKTVRPMGVQSVGSEDPRKIGNFKSFEEIDPGCYDAKKRIEVMDVDGCRAT